MDIFQTRICDSPIVLSMPHSGVAIPPTMVPSLTPAAITLPDTDWHIPKLYSFSDRLDATIVQANYGRYVVDLNRPRDNSNLYPGQSGTGLCPLELFDGTPIYHQGSEPDSAEISRRCLQYWDPYHAELQAQISRIKSKHGFAVLYDCHSIRSHVSRLFEGELPALNIGTNQGLSCAHDLQDKIALRCNESNFSSVLNGRFRGGYITRHYGIPENNVHSIQMEIAQSAYMEENSNYAWNAKKAIALTAVLTDVLQILLHWRPGQISLV